MKSTQKEATISGVVTSATINKDKKPKSIRDSVELRRICPRIRVLIIGRAGSGKTTILQKMRGSTTANPAVADSDEEVDPNAMYDAHNIDKEIFFPSNPRFVFHDSRGFEAGSTEEIDDVWRFVEQRSTCPELKDRLHVIWYCVPMDQRQVLSRAESAFFENGTRDVPIIVLFTKWDGRITASFSDLKQQGVNIMDAMREAPKHAMKVFQDQYLPAVTRTAHPAAAYVLLKSMHMQEATCNELTEITLNVTNSSILSVIESNDSLDPTGRIQQELQSNHGGFSNIWHSILRFFAALTQRFSDGS